MLLARKRQPIKLVVIVAVRQIPQLVQRLARGLARIGQLCQLSLIKTASLQKAALGPQQSGSLPTSNMKPGANTTIRLGS
jgi:hypothetical protein